MVQELYDTKAGEYDAHYLRAVDLVENELVFGPLGSRVRSKTLDLGCGTGLIHDYVKFDHYTGIDLSPGAVLLRG